MSAQNTLHGCTLLQRAYMLLLLLVCSGGGSHFGIVHYAVPSWPGSRQARVACTCMQCSAGDRSPLHGCMHAQRTSPVVCRARWQRGLTADQPVR